MKEDNEEQFAGDFDELFSRLRRARGACPQADELLDLHEGKLAVEAKAEIEEHASLCGRCQLLLNRLEGELDAASRAAAIQDWSNTDRRMTATMNDYFQATANVKKSKWFFLQPRFAFPGLAYALSVFLLLITVSLIYKTDRLQSELDLQQRRLQKPVDTVRQEPMRLAQVYANPSTVTLNFTALRSKPAETREIRVPVKAQILNFLARVPRGDYPNYRIEIHAISGDLKLAVDDLRPDRYSSLQFAMESNALAAGEYVIQVYGMKGQAPALVAEQRILLTETVN